MDLWLQPGAYCAQQHWPQMRARVVEQGMPPAEVERNDAAFLHWLRWHSTTQPGQQRCPEGH
jgi:hypothetical protein